ncbi:hypothetical protein [Microvirus mar30]|uniref:Uncharacterized protein n=1 Tax=Microvirus mar30 TaxID=2851164 RepID=A0A8F5ML22_9VIRU|nr:hypothetical protein [Microvirus mar30]
MDDRYRWKKKDNWRDDFIGVSCAYCAFDCEMELCISRDFYCDNWIPRLDDL